MQGQGCALFGLHVLLEAGLVGVKNEWAVPLRLAFPEHLLCVEHRARPSGRAPSLKNVMMFRGGSCICLLGLPEPSTSGWVAYTAEAISRVPSEGHEGKISARPCSSGGRWPSSPSVLTSSSLCMCLCLYFFFLGRHVSS